MNKFFKPKSILVLFLVTLFAFSCSSDDNTDLGIPDPGTVFDAELFVSEAGGDTRTVEATVDANTGTSIKSKVKFTTTTNSMRRLYITQEVNGAAAEPFVFTSQEVDEKADGSLDLIGDNKKDFEFQIDLPAPAMNGGSIVYTFWATTGRGDFRDVSKRNAIAADALGTITVKGSGSNTATSIKEYAIKLDAPLGDGSSESFVSLFNGELYKISEGEETAALWDFGYFYLGSTKAALASTSNYHAIFKPDPNGGFVNVSGLTGIAQEELNKFYFAASSNIDFDTATVADIDAIVKPTSERATDLTAGKILEFEDAYGNKGLIRVDQVFGTDGSSGFIRLTIKVKS